MISVGVVCCTRKQPARSATREKVPNTSSKLLSKNSISQNAEKSTENAKETTARASGEVRDSSEATTVTPTLSRRNEGAIVSDNIILPDLDVVKSPDANERGGHFILNSRLSVFTVRDIFSCPKIRVIVTSVPLWDISRLPRVRA